MWEQQGEARVKQMTDAEIDKLTGTDLDAAVAKALGESGTEHGYVSSDGGKS